MGYAKPELLTMCIRCCNKSDRAGLASWLEDIQHHLPPSLPLLFIGFQTLQSRRLIITYECYPKAQVSYTRSVGQIWPTRPLHAALTPLLQLRHPLSLAPSCLRSREHRGGQSSYARSCTSLCSCGEACLCHPPPHSQESAAERRTELPTDPAPLCAAAHPLVSADSGS